MLACWKTRTQKAFCSFLLGAISVGDAQQKKNSCPDGDHIEIDVKQIAIQYDASSFAGTLSSLGVLGSRLEVGPKKLQEAALATQQWNEFVKGLAAGYNTCAVTRQQYAEGLNRIYPRLKEDAANLEEIRKIISEGRKADDNRLQILLDSFYANLRRFAQISGQEIILDRIESLTQDVKGVKADTQAILAMLKELKRRNEQVPTPEEVGEEVSSIKSSLLAKANEAEAAYNKGYELLDRYRFREAIPCLRQALAAVQLPDFYLALGHAYAEEADLTQAEKVLRDGLTLVSEKNDQAHEVSLTRSLGFVLALKGDTDEALKYSLRALGISEKVYGPDHLEVATDYNNIGAFLRDKGDLNGALSNFQRALKIAENVNEPDHARLAAYANNIGSVLKAQGHLSGALSNTRRALNIAEKVYGPDDPEVAIFVNNVSTILRDMGDLDGALSNIRRALQIAEKVYGPDHPQTALFANTFGEILHDKGDLDGALNYTQRALKIDEKAYGSMDVNVAGDLNNVGSVLLDKGDVDGAVGNLQRALKIAEKVYGPDHPKVALFANNLGMSLKAKGDLQGALSNLQRALKIAEKVYGPDHPMTKATASNLEEVRQAMHR